MQYSYNAMDVLCMPSLRKIFYAS